MTLILALGAAWLMIFGPAVEYNTYVVLAPMITWALMDALQADRGRLLIGAAFAMAMVLGAGAVERAWVDACPLAYAVLPVGSCLFVLWLLFFAPRSAAA